MEAFQCANAVLAAWDPSTEKAVVTFTENTKANGVIATLTGEILDDAQLGDVIISCKAEVYPKMEVSGEKS